MNKNNFIAISENKPQINWFVVMLMSLYSQYTRDLIIKKGNDNVINILLTKYYYNNDLSKTFYSIISHEILLLFLLRETGHNNIRQYMINNKTLNTPMILMSYIHKYLKLKCLRFFNIHNTDNYYSIDNYYDYTINSDNKLTFALTKSLDSANGSKTETPDIIMIQKDNDDTDEAIFIKNTIINTSYEKVFNVNNTDANIKSLNSVITYNNNNYKLDSCIISSKDDNEYKILFHYNNKQYSYSPNKEEIKEVKWNKNNDSSSSSNSNDIKKIKSNLIAIYTLQ